jgi:tetratricopeptide (TPR) repeat protein
MYGKKCLLTKLICRLRLFSALVLLLSSTVTFARNTDAFVDSILSFPKDQQVGILWRTLYPAPVDTVYALQWYTDLQKTLRQRDEETLAREAWMMQVEYESIYRHLYSAYGIAILDRAIAQARDRDWKVQEAECIIRKGLGYYSLNKFGTAFEYMQRGYGMLKKIGFDQSPRIVWYLQEIGQRYYQFGDYEGAIQFLREALQVSSPGSLQREHHATKNTIALCFQKLGQNDSAMHYFRLSHEEALRHGDTFWAALANGNVGYLHFQAGDYGKALPLFKADFQMSHSVGEFGSAHQAASYLSTIYLKRGMIDSASYYLAYSKQYLDRSNYRDMAGYFKNMSAQSRFLGDYKQALIYSDSAQLYSDSLRTHNDANIIEQSRRKVDVENHAAEIRLLEATRSRQVVIRNAMLAILALAVIITMLLFNRQRYKRKKELELASLERRRAEDELDSARRELSLFTNALRDKNELIESFRHELDQLHQSTAIRNDERTEQMTQLLNTTILTEADWNEFRMLFEKVYPGFFTRLREKMTDLSPADTRLLALTKLQLAPKEMAAMLGLTYEAIKKSRQRLRKKINLPEEGTLDELVEMI